MSSENHNLSLSEDWVVVLLGFITILIALGGYLAPIPVYGWKDTDELLSKVVTLGNLGSIGMLFVFVYLFALSSTALLAKPMRSMAIVFPIVYVLAVLALVLAGNKQIKSLGLEAVIFSLTLGLIVSNLIKLPEWFRAALSTELYVKIGLVLLGTSVIFMDILKAGGLGLVQALVVVLSVWYFAFWLCKKFKIDDELALMISSAVSICGVSAAIATAGAIKGDAKKLSFVISMVLITAIPMMIFMPIIAKAIGLSEEVTGAWLGGTIDTTGAVVASSTLVGETALKISTIVKFSQNVLLGLAAFAISIYWAYTKKSPGNEVEKPTISIIWERFPKFVLGFLVASILFSFFIQHETIVKVKDGLKNVQTLWFVLAFTSIGLETKFSDLFKSGSSRPIYAFLIAQGFNIVVTLVLAVLLFR